MKHLILLFFLFGFFTPAISQQSPDCQVAKITVYTNILKRGGNPSYQPSGDSIVYQKNFFNWSSFILSTEVFVSDTGMTGASCLTCDTALLPQGIRHDKHKGNAEYHPGGNYILFTSENENGAHQPWNLPGAGTDNDIFIMDVSGTQFWRMTNIPAGHGILHPAFSADGTKLFWAEMYYSTIFPAQGEEYGLWEMKMADFDVSTGTPQISNIVTFTPRDSVWYEPHSFSPDGQAISFTSHQEDSSAIYGDITVMNVSDIGTSNFTLLTNTPFIHDEHSHWSPDGNKISWMSGTFVGGLGSYSTELYLMDANGANQQRLTFFTDPTRAEYIQDTVVVADHYWSPDGRRIFGFVHFIDSTGWPSELYQLEFVGPCGMNPTSVVPTAKPVSQVEATPNPASNQLAISFTGVQRGEFQYTMYNVFGEMVLTGQQQSSSATLDISVLAPGIYFLHLTAPGEVIYDQKIMIAR
ncbi:MAG TPA: T9SS type A sorting domain-containing protein [Bacteroidia bacterium]|nr:T9SS type A sorting domain-containing protein [Bacteroidia bacterium]